MRLDSYKQEFIKAVKQYFDKAEVSFRAAPVWNPDNDVLSTTISVGDNHVMLDQSISQIKRDFNEDIEKLVFRMCRELELRINK